MDEQPHPNRVRLLPWRVPDWLVDIILIALVVPGFIVRPFADSGSSIEASDWVGLAIAVALLLARRRYPLPTLAIGVIAAVVMVRITDRPSMLMPVVLVLLATVAVTYERRIALIAGSITTLMFAMAVIALLRHGDIDGAGLASIAWPAFAVAAGITVRTTRENLAAAQQRARRAEESRQLEARRQVIEERLRIARDVHDLVAHHIAVINVQSGVAGHLLESDPVAASEALSVVRGSAATVIDELGELLSVLRTSDDGDGPTAPTPDLSTISDLISSFAASGLVVRHETSGTPRPLTASAELAACRVIQEALTNAHKYGDGTATLSLRFDDTGLAIDVSNPSRHTGASGSGFGLIGMSERIEAVGGTLTTGSSTSGRRFEVHATLPAKDGS